MLIQTLRGEGAGLIVLDFQAHDSEHLSTILSKSMPYLERLDAMIVVIATLNTPRLGPSLMARFQDEFILEPFDEDIAAMIDARAPKNPLAPASLVDREHLGALPATHGSCSAR